MTAIAPQNDTLSFTEEERMIQELVRDFAQSEIKPIAIDIDREERFPRHIFSKMGELGLLGTPFPEAIGGADGTWTSYCLGIEEIAKVCASTALGFAAAVSLGIGPIANFGSDEQKAKYLPSLMTGEKLAAFGLTEANAGSDAGGSMRTWAKQTDDGSWILNGGKYWITNGNYADVFVVTARTDPEAKGSKGISSFLLERGTEGFASHKIEGKLGMRGSDTAELTFEDVRLPADALVGTLHDGFRSFLQTLDGGRIVIAALSLGIAEGAYERALAYAQERRQFRKPISEFQATRFKLADMATKIHASRLLVFHAANKKDQGLPFKQEAAMAKLYASEACYEVSKEAVQIHGGVGYCREYEVERMFRDAKLCEIGEGTSEVQRMVIARGLLRG